MKCQQGEEMVCIAVDLLSKSGGKQNTYPTSSNMVLNRYCSSILWIKMQASLRFSRVESMVVWSEGDDVGEARKVTGDMFDLIPLA
jgi:hypothetical protein